MTVISITKMIGLHSGRHRISELIAFNTLIFLISAVLSYSAMRTESVRYSSVAIERIADLAFMIGLAVMTIAGFLLTYEII